MVVEKKDSLKTYEVLYNMLAKVNPWCDHKRNNNCTIMSSIRDTSRHQQLPIIDTQSQTCVIGDGNSE